MAGPVARGRRPRLGDTPSTRPFRILGMGWVGQGADGAFGRPSAHLKRRIRPEQVSVAEVNQTAKAVYKGTGAKVSRPCRAARHF